jgi:hypothetical protein
METMERLEQKFDDLAGEVHDIKQILIGNDMIKGDTGIFGRMLDQEKRIATLEKWKDRLFIGAMVAALFGGWGITDIVSRVFLKK